MPTSEIAPIPAAKPAQDEFSCPNCGGAQVYRSQRLDWQEKVKCLFQRVLPYRCRNCDQRFFGRKPK